MNNKYPTFEVCIGNYGYYAEGVLRDAWLTLPVTYEEFAGFIKANHLSDTLHEEIYISDYNVPGGFDSLRIFNEGADLDDLNMLANQMVLMPRECEIVAKCLDAGCDEPNSIVELMNMICQAYELVYHEYTVEASTPEKCLAYTLLDETGEYQKIVDLGLEPYFDFGKFGRDAAMDVCAGEDGYVDPCNDFDPELYSREELRDIYTPHYKTSLLAA